MSGEVLGLLAELEYTIRSNPNEKITLEEEQYFRNLKEHFVDVFVTSSFVSSLLTWRATKKYGFAPRLVYSAGACFLGGFWGMKWVEQSSLNPILEADGSRMQKELANIMLAKHQMDSVRPSFISTHLYKLLYPEHVFGDKYPDKSFVRWRLRNSYEDNTSAALSSLNPPTDSTIQQTVTKPMESTGDAKPGISEVITADPLDCIFGHTERGGGDMVNSDDGGGGGGVVQTRRISRAQRRAQRKHQARERAQSSGASASATTTKSDHTRYQNPDDWYC